MLELVLMAKKRVGSLRRVEATKIDVRPKKRVERRRSVRLPLGVPVFVKGFTARGEAFVEFTTACNVSSGGALVATRQDLPNSSQISLFIPSGPLPRRMPPGPLVQTLSVTPVWSTRTELVCLVGLKFSKSLNKVAKKKAGGKVSSNF